MRQMIPYIYWDESKAHIAEDTSLNDIFINTACGHVYIEKYAFAGHGVHLVTGQHDPSKRGPERMLSSNDYTNNDIIIREGVWLGTGCIVLGPCIIGKDSVVAAGSVVLPGEYPEGVLLAGNPAVIKKNL